MAERTSPATLRSQPDYEASRAYLTELSPREGSRPMTESCLPHAQMEAESPWPGRQPQLSMGSAAASFACACKMQNAGTLALRLLRGRNARPVPVRPSE